MSTGVLSFSRSLQSHGALVLDCDELLVALRTLVRQDFETLGLAVCEEAGELAQAILQNKHENGERSRITHEALDLAALCVQVLVTMTERHGTENLMTALKMCPHCLRPCASKAIRSGSMRNCRRIAHMKTRQEIALIERGFLLERVQRARGWLRRRTPRAGRPADAAHHVGRAVLGHRLRPGGRRLP